MLARHAEDLFWAGRYLERAEDTARLLDVTYHGVLEGTAGDPAEAWQELLEVLQLQHAYRALHGPVTASAVEDFLVLDESNASSIMAAFAHARDNGRNVREHLSTELWEALNSSYLELRRDESAAELAAHPHEFYRRVRGLCHHVAGAASETMARRDAWRFLLLGRLLERAEMTCRLLSVRFPREPEPTAPHELHHWLVVLNSVSALESYTRAFGAEILPVRVLELLLLSPDFPRSVLFCLRAAEAQLAELEGGAATARVQRTLGRIRAELEFLDVAELLARAGDDPLERTQLAIREVADRIEDAYFARGPIPERHVYEST